MPYTRALLNSTLISLLVTIMPASFAQDVSILYRDNCAQWHNQHRLGGVGPALLPGNLKRLRKKAAIDVISNGRIATQMPGFSNKLSEKDIHALTELIYSPSEKPVVWGQTEIAASHIIHNDEQDLPDKPVFEVEDLLNLFLVV